ncbi:MAG: hypothetical protein CMJ83_12105 [Planctomycetes bacterium]|nr:hypothetical protein [Planctomycetota bacterium]
MSDRDAKKAEIIEALTSVNAPGTDRNVVDLGWVANVTHCDGAVRATIAMTIPGDAPRKDVQDRAATALADRLPWATEIMVDVNYEAPAAATPPPGGAAGGHAHGGPGAAHAGGPAGPEPLVGVTNVIAVASGKGGVGKSTVAVNLAAALARSGRSVGLLDADIYGPSIPTMLGQKTAQPVTVSGPGGKKMFAPVEAHGLKLMSMGFLVEEDRPVIWRGPMLHGALKQFFGDVAWGSLDFLIIDMPPGTGDVALTMAQTITLTGAIIVSTPQEVAMVDARKAVNMFEQTNIHLLGIVENMTGEIFGEGQVEQWAGENGHRFLGALPLVAGIRQSGDAGVPAALSGDDALAAPFSGLAEAVVTAAADRHSAAPPRKKISIQR